MVTCPSCLYDKNPDSAVKCEKCGNALTLAKDLRESLAASRRFTKIMSPVALASEAQPREKHKGKLTRSDIALYIGDKEEPVVTSITRDLLLGRFTIDSPDSPVGFDLTPYGAVEQGVSRKHALLRRLGPDIVVIDLGSTNGTSLNGVQLKPQEPVTIKSGDRVTLGQLILYIYLFEDS